MVRIQIRVGIKKGGLVPPEHGYIIAPTIPSSVAMWRIPIPANIASRMLETLSNIAYIIFVLLLVVVL